MSELIWLFVGLSWAVAIYILFNSNKTKPSYVGTSAKGPDIYAHINKDGKMEYTVIGGDKEEDEDDNDDNNK